MSAPSDQFDRPVSSFRPDHVSGRPFPAEPPPGARLNTSPSSFSKEGSFHVVLKRDWFCACCCWSFRLRSRNSRHGVDVRVAQKVRRRPSGRRLLVLHKQRLLHGDLVLVVADALLRLCDLHVQNATGTSPPLPALTTNWPLEFEAAADV